MRLELDDGLDSRQLFRDSRPQNALIDQSSIQHSCAIKNVDVDNDNDDANLC